MSRFQMAIDTSKCTNCKACLLACQQQNRIPFGKFRNWVKVTPLDSSPSGFAYQSGNCMQCKNATCVSACPTNATYYGEDGVIYVDEDKCIACSSCVKACPYEARFINPEKKVVDKCDYCASARAYGEEPACVRVCITKVRTFGNIDDQNSAISKYLAESQSRGINYIEAPNTKTEPSLAYIGDVYPKDWPQDVKAPFSFRAMQTGSKAVHYLGALSLFGVIAVFIKQIFLPSDDTNEHSSDTTDK